MAEAMPPPVTVENEDGASRFVLICEHASRFIPGVYGKLGLADHDLERHIAWDIGAADVSRRLSQLIDAPLVLAGYSRLLIDLNRPVTSETSIPEVSETTTIPGNLNISDAERLRRIGTYFTPFQSRVAALLDARGSRPTAIIAMHSFTPVFKGVARPWRAGILFRRSQELGRALVSALGGSAAGIAENQPYRIEDDSDYTVPVHGEARGHEAVLVELRQDLIATADGAETWSQSLAVALRSIP